MDEKLPPSIADALREAAMHCDSIEDPNVCAVCFMTFPCLVYRLAEALEAQGCEFGFTGDTFVSPTPTKTREEAEQKVAELREYWGRRNVSLKFDVVVRLKAGSWEPISEPGI